MTDFERLGGFFPHSTGAKIVSSEREGYRNNRRVAAIFGPHIPEDQSLIEYMDTIVPFCPRPEDIVILDVGMGIAVDEPTTYPYLP